MSLVSICDLFRRCTRNPSSEAWCEFTHRYDRRLRVSLVRALRRSSLEGSIDLTDELCQEIYCRLLEGGGRHFRGQTDLELWVYISQVARTVVADHLRSIRALKRKRPGTSVTGNQAEELPSPSKTPEERLLWRERRNVFLARCRHHTRGARAGLKRRAIYMAFLEGWSSREISRAMGGRLSAPQIDTLVSRLRARLAREGMPLPRRSAAFTDG